MADFGFEVNAVATGNERIQEYYMPPYIQGFYTNDGGTPRYDNRKKSLIFQLKELICSNYCLYRYIQKKVLVIPVH